MVAVSSNVDLVGVAILPVLFLVFRISASMNMSAFV